MHENSFYGPWDAAGPQIVSDRIYVDSSIVEYAKAVGIPLHTYCKQLEPNLPSNPTIPFIAYDPRNPEHVEDVINQGNILITTSVDNYFLKSYEGGKHFHKAHIFEQTNQPFSFSDTTQAKEIFSAPDEKDKLIKALNMAGIPYSKKPDLSDEDSELLKVRYIK